MKRRLTVSLALMLAVSCVCAFGLEFTHSADIKRSGTRKYKAIQLTADVYHASRPDLADLMLYDANNEPIPYFINSFIDTDTEAQKDYALKQVDSFVKNDRYYFDFTLQVPQGSDVTATSLEVEVADKSDFAKKVVVWAGYDGVNWSRIMEDTLYDVDGNRKLEIKFKDVMKYTYYRLELSNNLERVMFASARLKFNEQLKARGYFTADLHPQYTVEQKGSDTFVKFKDLKNLKLSSLTLKTDSMFKRSVAFDDQPSKELYHLQFNNNVYQDLTIPLGTHILGSDASVLVIRNMDDKPIDIKGVEVTYLVDEMIFDGSKSNGYVLRFGDPSIQQPKNYDIASYSGQILEQGYDVLKLQEIKENPKAPEKQESQLDYKLIFNITIVAAAVVMGLILLKKLKK